MKKFKSLIILISILFIGLILVGCNNTESKIEKYTVTFDSMGGSTVAPLTDVEKGSKITKPTPDPTKPNNDFVGWFKDSNGTDAWNFDQDKVNNNTTLYAKWNEKQEDHSNEVTKAQWEETFNNFSVTNGTLVSKSIVEDHDMTMTIEAESLTKVHIISTSISDQSYVENILYKDGNNYYLFARDNENGKYTRTLVDEDTFNQRISSLASPLFTIGDTLNNVYQMTDAFDNFVYDDTKKAYVGKVELSSLSLELEGVINFVDGNITSLSFSNQDNTMTSLYNNFGTTTVDVVKDFNEDLPKSKEVTEQEWQKAFEEILINSNYHLIGQNGNEPTEYWFESATKIHGLITGSRYDEVYLEQNGNNYYSYERENKTDPFIRTSETAESFAKFASDLTENANLVEFLIPQFDLVNAYSEAVYHEDEELYTVLLNLGGVTFLTLKITFDDNHQISEIYLSDAEGSYFLWNDFGKVTVTIPDNYQESSPVIPEMVEGIWKNIFSDFVCPNFVLEASRQGLNLKIVKTNDHQLYAITENGLTDLVNNPDEQYQEVYLDFDGEVYSEYVRFDPKADFTKKTLEQNAFEKEFTYILSLADFIDRLELAEKFSEFSFDDETNQYIANTDMMLDVDFYCAFDVALKFDKMMLVEAVAIGSDDNSQGIEFHLYTNIASIELPTNIVK